MVNLKDIHNAIREKQKGLNADIETLLKITKENKTQEDQIKKEEEQKEKEFNKCLNELGVKQI